MDDEGFSDSEVYTQTYIHGRITVMSAFRKDLFVSVTLPLLGLGRWSLPQLVARLSIPIPLSPGWMIIRDQR